MRAGLSEWLNSLTAKYVAVFVLLVAVPAIGISWYLLDSSYNDNKQALVQKQQAEARALAMTIGQSLKDARAHLGTIHAAGIPSSRVDSLLLAFRRDPNVSTAFYVDRRGHQTAVIGTTDRPPLTRRAFEAARNEAYYSLVHNTHIPGGGVLRVMRVATGENSGEGVVGEDISPEGLFQDVLGGVHVNRGTRVFAVDSQARIISFPDQAFLQRFLHGAPASEATDVVSMTAGSLTFLPQVKSAFESTSESGASVGRGPGGKVLSAWATVDPAGWKIFVEQPESAAFAPLRGKIWRTSLIIAGFVALAAALSILLARRLVRPIKRLQVAAEAIGAGAYGERIELHRKDELGALASAFNQMAAHLQELIGGLERRVADRTRQLAQASKHKSEFLANMSHELRTPLNAILGFTQVLQQKLFGDVNEKQAEYLEDIHGSADHLLDLINDVLDLSKVEAGQVELEKTQFSLREALERSVVIVRERASKSRVKLTLEPNGEVDLVEGDERRIRQVLFNLLSNAVKFTPPGGSVDVRSAQENGEVLVSVTDTGPGIAPEDQERVFEEFQQTDIGAEEAEGTGLGLALSKKLIELHGGRIWVESEPGKGSTFFFALPDGLSISATSPLDATPRSSESPTHDVTDPRR